jgi:hypothetical protein
MTSVIVRLSVIFRGRISATMIPERIEIEEDLKTLG